MSLRSTKIYLKTQKELAKHFELFWQKFTIYLLFDHFSQEGELYSVTFTQILEIWQ